MGKTLAVLTGGGHAAGLNAGIAGIIQKAKGEGWRIYGALDGWRGVNEDRFVNLTGYDAMSGVNKGGSILGSSRARPDADKVVDSIKKRNIDALIAMGGDDTLGALGEIYSDFKIPAVGWPKTMDNDLSETYFTVGYPTTITVASDAVAKSFDVACSHGRVAIAVVFGRHTDWVAAGTGAYGSADLVVPAEKPCTLDKVCDRIGTLYTERKKTFGKGFAVVVVAEGARISGMDSHIREQEKELDEYGHIKLDPHLLASYLSTALKSTSKKMFGASIGTAPIVLTYQLRNGPPVWIDMEFGYRLGERCVQMLEEQEGGKAAVVKKEDGGLTIGSAPLEKTVKVRRVEEEGLFNYEDLTPYPSFLEYGKPFLGRKREKSINIADRGLLVS